MSELDEHTPTAARMASNRADPAQSGDGVVADTANEVRGEPHGADDAAASSLAAGDLSTLSTDPSADLSADLGQPSPGQLAAAMRGERPALRAIWEQNQRWVAAVLLAHKPREADVEDLLHDVAAIFVKRVHELRDEFALRPWLRTVAINTARLAARSPSRRLLKFVGDSPEPTPAVGVPDASPAAGEEARRLLDLAKQLPDAYREPLLLKVLKELSYRQIGAVMGLPETTVETRIARARRMLRELAAPRAPESAAGASAARPHRDQTRATRDTRAEFVIA